MSNLYKRGQIYWLKATINGVQYRQSLRTSTLATARKIAAKRIEELRLKANNIGSAITYVETIIAWSQHAVGQIGETTASRYATSLKMLEPWLLGKKIDQIDGALIAEIMEARRRNGASAATIHRDLTALSRVLEYAEARGWREGNPTLSKRRLIKERRDPIMLPEAASIEMVIDAAPVRFGALVKAAWLTGCRQNELVTAKWQDFNAKAGTLEIIGKGRKRRVIALSQEAIQLFAIQPRTLESKLIFCQPSGEPFTNVKSDFTRYRRKAAGQSGFTRFRFHDLRHLFAVEALRSGRMSIYGLSKYLGHTSVKTTEIYLSFMTAEEAEAAMNAKAQI